MENLQKVYTYCGPCSRDSIDVDMLPYLKKCYTTILDGVDETSVTTEFQRYACCRFNGDLFWSTMSRGDRSAFLLARWCKFGGRIDTSGSDLRPGVINNYYFMKQNVCQWSLCNLYFSRCALLSGTSFKILLRSSS